MTMPYDAAYGRQRERQGDVCRSRRRCSAIIYTLLIGLLAAVLGLITGALLAIPVFLALPALFVFAAILVLLIVLKIIADRCAGR